MAAAALFGKAFAIGGHRGSGENTFDARHGIKRCLGVRENTVASFIKAATAQADFVEFDVQVTADGVPVIFHDDYCVHGTLWAPMRSLIAQLTSAQFRSLGTLMRWFKDAHTQAWLQYDNVWACEEEDCMPTLQDAFDRTPESLGFNIEIKMATSAALAQTPPCEVSRVVDPILAAVQSQQQARSVVISSFDPDVMLYCAHQCSLLGLESVRLWFLTAAAGEGSHADPRRTTLLAAAAFARESGMHGIVMDSTAARLQETSIAAVLASGLHIMTYGRANDDISWVLKQKGLGMAGVIADDIFSVVPCLKSEC